MGLFFKNKKAGTLILLSLFIATFFAYSVSAQPGPNLMVFAGTVKIDNKNASIGTMIVATVNGTEPNIFTNSTIISTTGQYSINIGGINSSYNGKSVNFAINGFFAQQNGTINIPEGVPGGAFLNLTFIMPPSKVNLTNPGNNSLFNANTPLPFDWTSSTDGNNATLEYILQISSVVDFSNINLERKTVNDSNFTLNPLLNDGKYYWKVYVTDGFSNIESDVNNFIIDINAPLLSQLISDESDGVVRSDKILNFTTTASDANLINVTLNETLMNHIGDNVYSLETTPTALGCVNDGVCLLNAAALDVADRINSSLLLLTIDNTAPVVSDLKSNKTNNISRSDGELNFTVSITEGNVEIVTLNGTLMQQGTGNKFFTVKKPSELGCSEPSCVLTVAVTDKAGNQNSAQYELTVDDTNPTISSFNGDVINNAVISKTKTISVTATDENSGIKNLKFVVNGNEFTAAQSGNKWTAEFDTTILADGFYTITAIAEDKAGNKNTEVATANHVVISEVLFDADGADGGRVWVELFNPTDAPISLNGWDIKGGTRIITMPSFTIQPKSTIIIANATEFNLNYGFNPDLDLLQDDYDFTNSNDFVQLRNSSDGIIDEVSWGNNDDGTYNWSLSAAEGNTITRNPTSRDTNQQSDWQSNTLATPGVTIDSNSVRVNIDNSAPNIESFSIDNNSIIKGQQALKVVVTDEQSDVDDVSLTINRGDLTTPLAASQNGGIWTATIDTNNFADGRYNITATANDSINNINSAYIWVIIDNNAPISSEIDPSTPFVNTTKPLFYTIIKDNASGVNPSKIKMNLSIDGEELGEVIPQITSVEDGFKISREDIGKSDTIYDIVVTAEDFANHSIEVSWTFEIDTKPPLVLITLINDTDNVVKSSDTIFVVSGILDTASGVKNAKIGNKDLNLLAEEVDIDDLIEEALDENELELIKNSLFFAIGTPTEFGCTQEGQCSLKITAVDNIGHVNDSESLTITIDDTNPKVSFTLSNTIVSNSTPVQADVTITDANFNTGNVSLKAANELFMDKITSNSWRLVFNSEQLGCGKNGDCAVTIKAVDSAANVNSSVAFTLSVDSTPPIISNIATDDTNNIVNSNQIIKINLSVAEDNKVSSITANSTNFVQEGRFWTATNPASSYCGNKEGTCAIAFNVTDNLTNTNSTQKFTITVDNTKPNVTGFRINGTDEINWLTEDVIKISVGATDLNGIEKGNVNGKSLSQLQNTNTWFVVSNATDLCGPNEGLCTLTINVYDTATNLNQTTQTINLVKLNKPPRILENFPAKIRFVEDGRNESLILNNFITDPDNTTNELTWAVESISNPKVEAFIDSTTRVKFISSKDFNGIAFVIFSVSDGIEKRTRSVEVEVIPVNDAPTTPTLISPANNAQFSGITTSSVTIIWEAATDVDNDALTYYVFSSDDTIPLLNGTTTSTSFTVQRLDAGKTYNWAVLANDSKGGVSTLSATRQYTIVPNLKPNITSFTPTQTTLTINETQPQTFTITKVDPEGQPLIVKWFLDNVNVKEEVDAFTFETNLDSQGTHKVEVFVIDHIGDNASQSWTINVANKNQPPVLTVPTQALQATEDILFNFTITATDPDNDALNYFSDNSAVKITKINNNKSRIEWTPTNDNIGTRTINFKVNDTFGAEDIEAVIINVAAVNDAPEIKSFSPSESNVVLAKSGLQGIREFSVRAEDVDSAPTIKWLLNGEESSQGNSYTVQNLVSGNYVLKANITDGELSISHIWNIEVAGTPKSSKYTGSLLNLGEDEIDNATNVKISSASSGSLDFGSGALDFTGIADLDRVINISNGVVAVDTENFPNLNKPAKIEMKALQFKKAPFIYFNNGFKAEGTNLCPIDVCTNVKYDRNTGMLTFEVTGFSTYFASQNTTNDPPNIVSAAPQTAIINEKFEYRVEVEDFDDNAFTFRLFNQPSGMAVSSNGVITWTPTQLGKFGDINITVTDDSGGSDSQIFNLAVERGPMLRIQEVDAKIGGKNSNNLRNNSKIRRDAKPGDVVKFDVEVANGFTRDEDIELQDVEIEITIEGIDDSDDLEETSKNFDIKPGKDEREELEFQIPLIVDEDTYDVLIRAEGEDETGKFHEANWVMELDVEKESHKVIIAEAALFPSKLECNKNVKLDTRLVNVGSDDENVQLQITNDNLGINRLSNVFRIEEDESSVESLTLVFEKNAEKNIQPGIYPLEVSTVSNGDEDTKIIDLEVKECVEKKEIEEDKKVLTKKPAEKKEKVEVVVEQPRPKDTSKVVVKSFRETKEYQVFLLISIGVLFILFVAIVTLFSVSGRKR